jgi:hypothetical protein
MTTHTGLGRLWLAMTAVMVPATALAVVQTVVIRGDAAPEASNVYNRFKRPTVGDAAGQHVTFFAKLKGTRPVKRGLFKEDPNDGGATVVLKNDVTPDSRLFTKFSRPSINASGSVIWQALVSGGKQGVYAGGPTAVALAGDDLTTATPAGTGFLKAFSQPVNTDAAGVVFRATIQGGAQVVTGSGTVTVDDGIFRCSGGDGNCSSGSGTLDILVLKNDPVPDRVGLTFCGFGGSRGEIGASDWGVAFEATTRVDCADNTEPLVSGIFRMPFGGPIVTVALGAEASNPSGTSYFRFTGSPSIEDDGIVAFLARVNGVFVGDVLFYCDPAACPASPAVDAVAQGEVVTPYGALSRFTAPSIANSGTMVFRAIARGASGSRSGIWVRRTDDSVINVALKNDPVPGLVPAAVYRRFGVPSMSPGGIAVFDAGIKRADVTPHTVPGIFVDETAGAP